MDEVERVVDLPTICIRCGEEIGERAATGRPRLYCSTRCRQAAHRDRLLRRDGAVRVQLVERVVEKTIERRVTVRHSATECAQRVRADRRATWQLLHDLARDINHRVLQPEDEHWSELYGEAEYLWHTFRWHHARFLKAHGVAIDLEGYRISGRDDFIESIDKPWNVAD